MLTGREFKAIRQRFGYSRPKVAGFLGLKSETSISNLEEKKFIVEKYVQLFRNACGSKTFDAVLKEIREEALMKANKGERIS